jgi:hypothetical protein
MANRSREGAVETIEEILEGSAEAGESETNLRDMESILEDTVDIADAAAAAETAEAEMAAVADEAVNQPSGRRFMRRRTAAVALLAAGVAAGVLGGMYLKRRASSAENEDLFE